jgi:hypothetical protein
MDEEDELALAIELSMREIQTEALLPVVQPGIYLFYIVYFIYN